MNTKEIKIPDGYEARIEGNKVVFIQKESEDEKIRQEIITYLRSCHEPYMKEWISYLEKLKKQDKNEREYTRTLKSLIADVLYGKEEVDREYYQRIYDWLEGRHIEQKPQTTFYMPMDNCEGWVDESGYHIKQKEQKPAVPNKEDDAITKQFVLNQLFSLKEHINFGRSWEYIPLIDGLIKAISESIAVITPNEELPNEKPAEWSEEDIVNWAYDNFRVSSFDMTKIVTNFSSMDELERSLREKLKSLRPKPKAKLTLLDKNIIEAAVAFVEQNDHFNCCGGIDKHTVIKALRSLKPHWKPSEEQMKIFNEAIEHYSKYWDSEDVKILCSLYDDLEKLM